MGDLISKEDAIRALWKINDEYDSVYFTAAIHRAVDVIEKMPSAEVRTQMSSADCISRQAAIDMFQNLAYDDWNQGASTTWANAFSECAEMIRHLPSAEPEIIRCKDCRWGRKTCGNIECFVDINVPPEYHGYEWYCPNGERREE